jgi:hypothetical protein
VRDDERHRSPQRISEQDDTGRAMVERVSNSRVDIVPLGGAEVCVVIWARWSTNVVAVCDRESGKAEGMYDSERG